MFDRRLCMLTNRTELGKRTKYVFINLLITKMIPQCHGKRIGLLNG